MGQAQSNNFTNAVIGTYTKVVQDTNSNALQNSLNQARIEISGGTGNVKISNTLSKQTIKNDLTATFKTVNESSVLQKVSQQISQQASSLISGLNLGNFSESTNSINTALNASMDVSQTISTTCSSTAANTFEILVKNQQGDVDIDNTNIDQSIENSMKCATESMNKSIASQEIENKIAQKAVSETKGLSLDFLTAIVAGIIVVMIVITLVGSKFMALIGIIMPIIIVSVLEYVIYSKKLVLINQQIEKLNAVIKQNEDIFKQPKPYDQLRTFSYTCGLYGIDTYTGCFSSSFSKTTPPPPKQNIAGCTFQEVPINVVFSNPDQAFNYWLNQPDLNGVDIISKNDGASYEYHFYKNVSKSCIKLMEDLTKKDSPYVKIPPLYCEMRDVVESSKNLPTLPPDVAPTFIFTLDGYLYYTENNVWKQYNTNSLFKAKSKDNIKISITPLEENDSISIPNTTIGDYFFIDMSKARKNASDEDASTHSYYYTIYRYSIGDNTRPPNFKLELVPSNFTEIGTLNVNDLVRTKNIGPFMTNPKVLTLRNYTVIWDSTIDIRKIQDENQQLLEQLKKQQKTCYILMGVVAGIGSLLMIISSISFMLNKKNASVGTIKPK